MASGRAHDLHAAVGAAVLGGITYAVSRDTPLTIAAVAGHLFGGWLCSPDVDLPQSSVTQRWIIFSAIWWPFTLLGHRSWLTHTPIISGLIRLAYIGIALLLIAPLWPTMNAMLNSIDMHCAAMACVAFLLAGEIHIIADYLIDIRRTRAQTPGVEGQGTASTCVVYRRAAWAERPARLTADYSRTRAGRGNRGLPGARGPRRDR